MGAGKTSNGGKIQYGAGKEVWGEVGVGRCGWEIKEINSGGKMEKKGQIFNNKSEANGMEWNGSKVVKIKRKKRMGLRLKRD